MLDDLKFIHERDEKDTLGIAEKQCEQLNETFKVSLNFENIQNIVYAGMGGSALAAQMSISWPGYNIPFEICRSYNIPKYVSEHTLFIASSYSGNTEETLSALNEAEASSAKVAIITAGGQLQKIADEKNYPVAILPQAEQPRYAVLFNLKALLTLFKPLDVFVSKNIDNELSDTVDLLKESVTLWRADVPTSRNRAKQIAQELMGKSIVIYSGPLLYPAAYKWKISFNENAKHIAWLNQLSEFNHNEFIGWTKQPVNKPYSVIDLRSNLEHPRIQKRFILTEKLLSGVRPSPIVIEANGSTLLEQLLWTTVLGDFVSLYLALLSNLDPAPVELVEKFKRELNA
jgi:glucose/mannose-6-phosphate isomerase